MAPACAESGDTADRLDRRPFVVGWGMLRQVDEAHFLNQLRRGVSDLASACHFATDLVDPVSHMLLAALNEAAL
jgi:hypothetical protein